MSGRRRSPGIHGRGYSHCLILPLRNTVSTRPSRALHAVSNRIYSQNACSFLCRSPLALTKGHCRQRYVVLLVVLVPLLLLCMCPLTLLSLWSDWIRRVYPSVAGWRADSRRFLMCSGQPVSCASQCCDPHNILHPNVCAGAVGLFVSPTTEPLRVGVRLVADMASGVSCCSVAGEAQVTALKQRQSGYTSSSARRGRDNKRRIHVIRVWRWRKLP